MKQTDKILKIVVLDDSYFYNKLLTKQIENLSQDKVFDSKPYSFLIESYLHLDDFFKNINQDIDIVFIDYNLGHGVAGVDVIKQIHKKSKNCKIIIVSNIKNRNTVVDNLSEGATAFIYKDKNALSRACFFVEHIAANKYSL